MSSPSNSNIRQPSAAPPLPSSLRRVLGDEPLLDGLSVERDGTGPFEFGRPGELVDPVALLVE